MYCRFQPWDCGHVGHFEVVHGFGLHLSFYFNWEVSQWMSPKWLCEFNSMTSGSSDSKYGDLFCYFTVFSFYFPISYSTQSLDNKRTCFISRLQGQLILTRFLSLSGEKFERIEPISNISLLLGSWNK